MKQLALSEVAISAILLIISVLLVSPFNYWMTHPIHMTMLALLGIAFVAFAVFVWRENVHDEREQLHRFVAARFAYLTGVCVLVLATMYQSFHHRLDGWIIVALAAIVIAKVVGLFYSRMKY